MNQSATVNYMQGEALWSTPYGESQREVPARCFFSRPLDEMATHDNETDAPLCVFTGFGEDPSVAGPVIVEALAEKGLSNIVVISPPFNVPGGAPFMDHIARHAVSDFLSALSERVNGGRPI